VPALSRSASRIASYPPMSALSALAAAAQSAAPLRAARPSSASRTRSMSTVVRASVKEPVRIPQPPRASQSYERGKGSSFSTKSCFVQGSFTLRLSIRRIPPVRVRHGYARSFRAAGGYLPHPSHSSRHFWFATVRLLAPFPRADWNLPYLTQGRD